ncbi:hypothetical protein [Acinetobacter sp. UBA6720]|jgi:hypothetical protein|uniref:hypothetical protein n=1 Tax=Acinetobacter sp. UBA6720 TaxID=1945953 RepID=UPI0025C2957A|nr:hypothetical protein [Acinetobacter sp. UBA6720]
MMNRLFFLFVISLMYACTTEADQLKSSNTRLYFSYKICENSGKCKNSIPTKKSDNYLFKKLEPAHDEFYIKDNNGDFYLYYKIIYSEDVQVGWAKARVDGNNDSELILNIDKINLALGGIDFMKNGYASKQAESKNFKLGIYYLEDEYEDFPYYQKQKIFFKKSAGELVLECNNYLNNSSVKDNFYGIFYGVCSEDKKVYFKQVK